MGWFFHLSSTTITFQTRGGGVASPPPPCTSALWNRPCAGEDQPFMVVFENQCFRIQKSKPFCNLTPWKSTTGKGQVNPGSKGQICALIFPNKNKRFWTSLISGFQKCHFYFYAMSRNSQHRSLKNEVVNEYQWFWAICLPKIVISTWKLACKMPRHNLLYVFWELKKYFGKIYIKFSVFLFCFFFYSFALNLYFIFDQKWHDLVSLKSLWFQ